MKQVPSIIKIAIKVATLSICAVSLLALFGASTIEAQTAGRSNVQKAESAAVESNKRWAPQYYLDDPALLYGVEQRTVEVELRWGPSYDDHETAIYPASVPTVTPQKWGPSYAEDDPALIGIYNLPATSTNP